MSEAHMHVAIPTRIISTGEGGGREGGKRGRERGRERGAIGTESLSEYNGQGPLR